MHRISEFAVYLAAFADVPARRQRERGRERERTGEERKAKRGERVALFTVYEGGSKDETGEKREKTVRGDCSSGCANCTTGLVPAKKIIFKRPERGGFG